MKLDLTGQRFGKLLAIKEASERKDPRFVLWECICDCGKSTLVRANALRTGGSKSCGCAKIDAVKYSKRLPAGEATYRMLYRVYKQGAKRRGLEWGLEFEEFKSLVKKDCAYCGLEPSNPLRRTQKSYSKEWVVASEIRYSGIDRKDNTQGYILSNCMSCCKICNYAKSELTLEQFKEWLRRVTRKMEIV